MFNSFFSTLKSFVSELLLTSSESLNNIELGGYIIINTLISEISADLVIIIDKQDLKVVRKFIPKIIKFIQDFQLIFTDSRRTPEQFEFFDQEFTNLILSNKKLISQADLVENQGVILKSIWEQKGSLSEEIRENLIKENESILEKYPSESNYIRKYNYIMKLIDISGKLRDEEKLIEYQKEAKPIRDEIKDRKIRLQYYLDNVKEEIRFYNYRDAYSALYSFCEKLESFAEPEIIEKYSTIAEKLLLKKKIDHDEFFAAVEEVKNMSKEVENYFPSDEDEKGE